MRRPHLTFTECSHQLQQWTFSNRQDGALQQLSGENEATGFEPLFQLHECNRTLWNLEDDVRDEGRTDSQIAALKRRIDEANLRRNKQIEAVDRWFITRSQLAIQPSLDDTPYHTESPGMMLDRLSILHLRCRALENDPDMEDKYQSALSLLHVLECAADDVLLEVVNGIRRFYVLRDLKAYGMRSPNLPQ